MNIRYLILMLSAIALMGCSSDDSSTPAAAASNSKKEYVKGAEYTNNPALEQMQADEAYARGYSGAGQIISVYTFASPTDVLSVGSSFGHDAAHAGLADVFVDGYDAHTQSSTNVGACLDDACRDNVVSKFYATNAYNGMVGRNEGTGVHGVAYDAKIKVISGYTTDFSQLPAAIRQGGHADIAAMVIADWIDTNDQNVDDTTDADSSKHKFYKASSLTISIGNDKAAWKDVTDTTILISSTGNLGLNSVNSEVNIWDNAADRNADSTSDATVVTAVSLYGSATAANIAKYSSDITHSDFAGKWIATTGVDEDNVILATRNGCGAAKKYCLAVPQRFVSEDAFVYNEYILGGAIAVIKEAYPNLTVEEIVALTLGTADYIANDTGLVDDATGKYNAVYGHGLLNLDAATTLTADQAKAAYVFSNSAIPLDASWGDTNLTLSSHFGGQLDSVKLGIGDKYGRHFVVSAQHTAHESVAVGLDNYMSNLWGENVQSEKLGGQAQANYANNSDGQNWMNLEYKSGNSTTKLAFQDSYKINPLNDSGATSILRANHIRPASHNIGMMDVDYALTGNLSLSSYAARGEYDTGYKFDELGTDFDVTYNKSTLNIGIGHLREHDQFLGTNTTGAYALNAPTISRFTDVTYGHDVGNRFNIYANYINYETDVDMVHSEFATIDGLQADQYQVGFKGKNIISKDDGLNVALITKLGVTDGALNQNTVLGYTEAGEYNNVTQSYDLAVQERHQQFEITYQGKLYQNADKVSALQDNRFFTTVIVDRNLNHQQGASQTEIVSGVNARF